MHEPITTLDLSEPEVEPAFERAQTLNRELHRELLALQETLVPTLSSERPLSIPAAIVPRLLHRYAQLGTLDAILGSGPREVIRAQHKVLVQPFFLSVPLIRRSVDRPLGYPGDYLMVEMIFGAGPPPDGPLAALLTQVVLESAPSRAHRYRAPWASGWLDALANDLQRPLRILSFACGPELVLRTHFERGSDAHVVLCDHDAGALSHAEAGLAPLLHEPGSLRCVRLSAVNLLRAGGRLALLQGPAAAGFDAVLVLGLFDYLSDGLVRRMVRAFHALLSPEGLLLASNLSVANPHRSLMEYVADWQVLHRSERDFGQLMVANTGMEVAQLTSDPSGANLLFVGRPRAT